MLQDTATLYHLDHSLFLQEKAQIILQNYTSNITTQDNLIIQITILINSSIDRTVNQSNKLQHVRSKCIKRKNTNINLTFTAMRSKY